jgi:hypothetical protein
MFERQRRNRGPEPAIEGLGGVAVDSAEEVERRGSRDWVQGLGLRLTQIRQQAHLFGPHWSAWLVRMARQSQSISTVVSSPFLVLVHMVRMVLIKYYL